VFKGTRGFEIEYMKYVFIVMKQRRWKRGGIVLRRLRTPSDNTIQASASSDAQVGMVQTASESDTHPLDGTLCTGNSVGISGFSPQSVSRGNGSSIILCDKENRLVSEF
jgi:hypothetical protein